MEGIYRLMLSEEKYPVNLGNPTEITIRDFALLINELTGNKAGLITRFAEGLGDDPQRRRPDISRAKALLGWEPSVDLTTGLRETINYFRWKEQL